MDDKAADAPPPGRKAAFGPGETRRWAHWLAVFVIAVEVILLGWKVGLLSTAPNYYGSASAPHSDALQPWLQGTLGYAFHGQAGPEVYRPTMGVMFSSVLAATGRIGAIPLFAMALLAANLVALVGLARWEMKVALAGLLGALVWQFDKLFKPLNPWTLMPDLPAFAFTACGLLMVGTALAGPRVRFALLCPGMAWVGLAAAIRGPQMFGGAAILGALLFWYWKTERKLLLLAAIGSFALPLAIDFSLQAHNRTKNNGIISLHCFYAAPDHQWSKECQAGYVSNRPSDREIVQRYVAFLFSTPGAEALLELARKKVKTEAAILGSWPFLLLAVGAVVAGGAWRELRRFPSISEPIRWRRLGETLVHVVALPLVLMNLKTLHLRNSVHFLLLSYVAVIAVLALLRRQRLSYCALALYLAGTFFVLLLGLPGGRRVTATFDFALFLGWLALILEPPGHRDAPAESAPIWPGHIIGVANAVFFAGLYCLWLLPTGLKRTFHAHVEGRPAALKIADDPRLDRSLYYTGDDRLFYTHHTSEEIGAVRLLDTVEGNDQRPNESFHSPARIRE